MISVIVPVYNVEKYIVKCLESIVNQDYKDFELLLIDDGSTDSSCNSIRKYLKDKSIKWKLIEKENGGQSSSRNVGLKEASGEYISFIDSDDYISKDFLSKLIDLINSNDYDFSFCNYKFIKEQETQIDTNNDITIYNTEALMNAFLKRSVSFVLPSMLFRKSFLDKNDLVFDERIKFSEDQMYIWKVLVASSKTIYINRKMYGYYLREKSIMTSSPFNKIMNGYDVYKEFCEKLEENYPQYNKTIKMILPRWSLGTLYSSAKLLTFEEYQRLYLKIEGNKLLDRIKGINDRNSYLLAFVAKMSCKILYKLCNFLKLE